MSHYDAEPPATETLTSAEEAAQPDAVQREGELGGNKDSADKYQNILLILIVTMSLINLKLL